MKHRPATAPEARNSPKSRDEHMLRKAGKGPQSAVAQEFGVHQSTVSRSVKKQREMGRGQA